MKLPKAGKLLRTLASAPPNRVARRASRQAGIAPNTLDWRAVARGASRFGLAYAGLYCLTNSEIVLSTLGGGLGRRQAAVEAWSKVWAIRPLRDWVATHVFNTTVDDRFKGGDNRYAWVGQFCWLATAAAITPVWSALDRRQKNFETVQPWIHTAVRMCLAGQMFFYGAAKAIPLQFQTPLSRLVEPVGNFSPMDLLWAQTGYSKPYQILLGGAEIAGGLLLIGPKTATAGALLSSIELAQVFILNMAFDVPVKLHSLHLLLLSLMLLAPESRRLVALLSGGEVHLPPRPGLYRSPRANQIAAAAQVLAGLWLLGMQLRNDWELWKKIGSGAEKPALYGIWDVAEFAVDGEQRPPLTNDKQRWQRVIFDRGNLVSIQHMDDSLVSYLAAPDPSGQSITLMKMTDPQWTATLSVQRLADELLTLDGEVDGEQVRGRLHRMDHDNLPLTGRGFHWVQENSSLR